MALPADCKQLDQMDHRIGVSVAKRIAIDAADLLARTVLLVLGKSVTPKAKGCAWLLSL